MNRNLLQSILNGAVDAIITIDERGLIQSANPATETLFGYSESELCGQNVHILMPSPYHEAHDGYLSNYQQTGAAKIIGIGREVTARRKDGTCFPIHLAVSEAETEEGTRYVGIIRDISDLKEAQSELRATNQRLESSEAFHRGVLEAAAIGILTTDAHGVIRSANQRVTDILAMERSALIGTNLTDCFTEGDRATIANRLRAIFEPNTAPGSHEETVALRADESTCPVSLTLNPVALSEQQFVTAIIKDITIRKELEKDVLRAADEERQRIAQDLHDGLASHLTGVNLVCEMLTTQMEGPQRSTMEQVQTLIGGAIQQTRQVARGLYPVEDDPEGLMNALNQLAFDTRQNLKVDCRFHCPEQVPMANNPRATHLYRIAQEAVMNAIRHGRAPRIVISLEETDALTTLCIRDNGSGMPLGEPTKHKGIGLRIMGYRIGLLHGTMEVSSPSEGGVHILCSVPRETDSH